MIAIDQTNNSYIFPGMGLGILVSGARRVSDAMFMAAAKAVAEISSAGAVSEGRLLPPIDQLRAVALTVGKAVARQAQAEGLADPCEESALDDRIEDYVWEPRYPRYVRRAAVGKRF